MSLNQGRLNIDDLAPISISVYTRLNHFRQCIHSLQKNLLAKKSELYIFSDGARLGDEHAVDVVRGFAKKINGFKKVNLFFQEKNNFEKNISDALEIPINLHEKIIRMEDDNIVSPFFLKFMNEGLLAYRDKNSILGISGYSPPINLKKYVNNEVYLSQLWSGWTDATWKDRCLGNYINFKKPYEDMLNSNLRRRVSSVHPRLEKSLRKMDEGSHKAGDQLISYCMIKYGLFQIKPVYSLVQNIGHDGSGMHCGISNRFSIEPYSREVHTHIDRLVYNPILDNLQYRFFYPHLNIFRKIANRVGKIVAG